MTAPLQTLLKFDPPPILKEFVASYVQGDLFYDWVCGPVGCLPCDSEFLTPSGWKRMDVWAPGDEVAVYDPATRLVRFETARHVRGPASEPFYRFAMGSVCMDLSPDHRVLYEDHRGVMRVDTAKRCAQKPSTRLIPTTFGLDRDDFVMSDAWIRLRVAFSADGHLPAAGFKACVTVRKERKKARLRELLTACGLEWVEKTYSGRPTETSFRFSREGFDKSLAFVWALSSRQLAVVVEECLLWDGLADHAERRYYTTVAANADAIQFAAHAIGLRARIKAVDDPRGEGWRTHYTVSIRTGDNAKNRVRLRNTTEVSRRDAPDGMQYCFETSTGFFVARCRGDVFVTGNSAKTTNLFVKLVYMASLQQPSPDGIRRTRAVVVRNTRQLLRDTTIVSFTRWFRPGEAGYWSSRTDLNFMLRVGDVECEILFRPLDTPEDVHRVLSLEVTFAIIDEFVHIPRAIIESLSGRLGRWQADGGVTPATNWGMWGASNTATEDNWWYDFLHDASVVQKIERADIEPIDMPREELRRHLERLRNKRIVRYFLQPSAFTEHAENVDRLPGQRSYYDKLIVGKTAAWIKQFVEAEWGYSASGKPVVPGFSLDVHVAGATRRAVYDPLLPLVVGFDPGLAGTAAVFGQLDEDSRLMVLGELTASGMPTDRFLTTRFAPYLHNRFPGARVVFAPDPASENQGQARGESVVSVIRRHYEARTETNNRFGLRLDAIEHYVSRLTPRGPALVVDAVACPQLTRALRGGWRYEIDQKRDALKGPRPEKNPSSHIGDAFGYLCRYFHRQGQRQERIDRAMSAPRPRAAARGTYAIG